ncbi:hypothetical protein ElyMa_000094900 [Elysia marginata]|uniref:Uncharacterized protein n=1 Tax=Elysia marginata TaxID=1093978 RepID=A0AAV4EJA5_9GAST|nr:hypothetical protein ElyMa_000094900 [Elysia marginata]
MPRQQTSVFDGIGFGKAVDHTAISQKRKLALDVGDFDHDMEQDCNEQSQQQQPVQELESLPGCLKNSSQAVHLSSTPSCPVSSSLFTSYTHQRVDSTQDVAAAVSFSSAALTSSVFTSPPMSSPSTPLSTKVQACSPSLADLFKSRLRQRQLELEGSGPGTVPHLVYDNNANCFTQDMTVEGMGDGYIKEPNNNNNCNSNNNNNNASLAIGSHQEPIHCGLMCDLVDRKLALILAEFHELEEWSAVSSS